MACNGVHLLEFLLVDITISPRFPLGFCKFSTTNTEELVGFIIFLILLGALLQQSCLDSSCFLAHVLHDFVGFFAEVGFWTMEAEFKGRRRHMAW